MMNYEEISTHYNLTIEEIKYLCRNKKTPVCKCGEYKILKINNTSKIGYSFYRCCGKTECEPNFGRKRPDHLETMKFLAKNGSTAYKETLIKRGQKFNKEVNTYEFKKKRLTRHGYDVNGVSDVEIDVMFSKLLSDFNTNIDRRKRDIINRFEAWEEEYRELILVVTNNVNPTLDWLDVLDVEEVNEIWRRIHGINTIRNSKKIKSSRSKFFKQEWLTNFKYNIDGIDSVFTKSGLEKSYINFFEENEIPWSYEPFILETKYKDGFHIPDFFIKLDGEEIVLEVKGGFFRQNIQEYYPNKILSAIEFCKQHNYRYILTKKRPTLDFSFITKSLIDTKIGKDTLCLK